MHFRIFSLHPNIFESFFTNSLIARAISKKIITTEIVNWREKHGIGNYKQVDDKPYGGGQGMVLQIEPIYQALKEHNAVSKLFTTNTNENENVAIFPNNQDFFSLHQKHPQKQVTINLTPRGFTFNQQIADFLSGFDCLNLICGRYEGFDHRVNRLVDMEISLGNFILNGGEIASMALIEAVSRLVPGFIEKAFTTSHDSFSKQLNYYPEHTQYSKTESNKAFTFTGFNNLDWRQNILPQIEHPQYTRPEIWQGYKVPNLLLNGNHKQIQIWRQNWYRQL